ncbi:DUF6703 family protein [Catellatospora sichuanensis]|uniref:DUF6703 family protein n=1 Tax=Catellatospora sichuanensis TaxID=1969805 RepID=UPI001182C051|nr:DUF6703 family protein [Catellatospora sichuanensis]
MRQDVASNPLFRRLARVPKSIALLGTLALLVAAVVLPNPYGGILLLALAAALAALLVTTWPVQPPATRGLRVVVLTLLAAAALTRLF